MFDMFITHTFPVIGIVKFSIERLGAKHGPQRQLELTVGSHLGLTTYRLQSLPPLH